MFASNGLLERDESRGQFVYNLSSLFSTLLFSNVLLINKIGSNSLNSSMINENNKYFIQTNRTFILLWSLIIVILIFGCLALIGYIFLVNKKSILGKRVIFKKFKNKSNILY